MIDSGNKENFNINDGIKIFFSRLESFSEDARRIYLNLGKLIPNLIEKISKDFKDLSLNIDLISNLDMDNEKSLNNFISKIIGALDDFVVYFNSSASHLESHFDIISAKIKDIEIFEDVIEGMKKSSLDMEIMSINTLTVAMRAGKAGGAFSYITNEIKVLTQSMIKQADQLTSKGQDVKVGLDRAKNQVYESNITENKILDDFKNDLMTQINEFLDGVGGIIALYDDILKIFSTFKLNLVSSISYLQFQDLLTQSLQHLNIMYSGIDFYKYRDTNEIQKLKILSIFTDTSRMIIKDILDKLDKNYAIFEEFIETSLSSIQNINNLRSNNSLYVDISRIIEQFSNVLSDLLKRIEGVEKNHSNFLNLYYEQVKLIKSLELMFSNISAISARFQNINIASKIEVAKRSELEDMEGNISEMSKIIKDIDSNIIKGMEFLDQIIFFFEKVVKDYDNRFYLEKNYFNRFQKLFTEIRNNIFDIKKISIEHILSYEIFPIDFLEIFEDIKLEVSNIKNLKSFLLDIEAYLSEIEIGINDNLNLELLKNGIQSVEIEDREFIHRIADRFTLFVHKKYLLSLIEEVKEFHSFDEGSIILF